MKTLLCLLLFAATTTGLFAQYEFAPKSAKWHYGWDDFGKGKSYCKLIYSRDTTISGKTCKVMAESCYDNANHIIKTGKYIIHQDSSLVSVWMGSFFTTLYNFKAQKGDTIVWHDTTAHPYRKMWVDSISTITISGKARKYFHISFDAGFADGNPPFDVVEGIGGVHSFIPSYPFGHYTYQHDSIFNLDGLRCYYDSALTYVVNPAIACDSVITWTVVKPDIEVKKNKDWDISPNPTMSILKVAYKGTKYISEQISIDIYNNNGKRVLSKTTFAIPVGRELDLKNLASGLYTLKIHSSHLDESFKILKQ